MYIYDVLLWLDNINITAVRVKPATSTNSAVSSINSTASSTNSTGLAVGLTIGLILVAVLLLAFTMVAVFLIRKKRHLMMDTIELEGI